MNLDEPLLCNCIKQPLNPMCLVKIHGEEMPGDVESIGAEVGVTDMDKIDEVQQLSQLLGVEQATGDAKYMNDSSSENKIFFPPLISRPLNRGGGGAYIKWNGPF